MLSVALPLLNKPIHALVEIEPAPKGDASLTGPPAPRDDGGSRSSSWAWASARIAVGRRRRAGRRPGTPGAS